MNTKLKIFIAVIITAVASSTVTLFIASGAVSRNLGGAEAKLDMIDFMLQKKYLYDYDKSALSEAAVKAYVDALDEPYTTYYTPEEFHEYTSHLQDGYTGIGVTVAVNDNNEIEVIAPFEGSPAIDAGIMPGDILTAVEGTEYDGSSMDEAIAVIRGGVEGSTVNITILRDGEIIDMTVERRDISQQSVSGEMIDDNIGYIRISSFNTSSENGGHSTATDFEKQLSELSDSGMQKLIIDLRDNPGGVLDVVCDIADRLLPEGTIMYTEDKNGKGDTFTSDAECIDVPMAVLINGNSASASEVLTGALKDHGKAVVVGEKSYGKGVVQDVYTLPDGSGISMTTSKYYTPSGVCIHDIGIEPDITVALPEKYDNMYAFMIEREDDTQLQKAIEALK